MNLDNLEGVNVRTLAILQRNGWTVSELATASAQKLAVIPGIGLKSATDAIRAAQKIVNVELLAEAAKPEYNPMPPEPTQRSVRVRRIYGEKI